LILKNRIPVLSLIRPSFLFANDEPLLKKKNQLLIFKIVNKMSSNQNLIAGLLSGAAIGLIVGVLYAPDEGSKTRKKIKSKATDVKNSVVNSAQDVKGKVIDKAHEWQNQLAIRLKNGMTMEEELDHLVSSVGNKTDDMITVLEKKLANLKNKNNKVTLS
jgi:gas vesicle protein